MPQGFMKATVVLIPRSARIGKVSMFADFNAPPLAPGAGSALLKEKTVRALRASPVRRDWPWTSRRWKRSTVESGRAWTEPRVASARIGRLLILIMIVE